MSSDIEFDGPTPVKKSRQSKLRPSEAFKSEYPREFAGDMIKASTKGNGYFFCGLCKTDNVIGKAGKTAITRHNNSKAHQDAKKAKNASAPMDFFVTKGPSTSDSDKNSIVEATIAYHIVKHHQGFVQADCLNELLPSCFKQDAKLYKVSQKKAKAIVCNVLSPHFLQCFLAELHGRKFSLSTDASNHGDEKVFPLLIRYSVRGSIKNRLLELTSLPGEKAVQISELIISSLQKFDLPIDNFIGFCADNAKANFGGITQKGENNVFALLKKTKTDLIGIGCFAHVIHKAASTSADYLSIDIEQFVFKLYGYFHGHTIRVESLKKFCTFVEIDYQRVFKHGKTRWLTLRPSIERILNLWPALLSYFESLAKPPKAIITILQSSSAKVTSQFLFMVLRMFNEANLELQRFDLTIVDLWQILTKLQTSLEYQQNQRFFGIETMKDLDEIRVKDFEVASELENEFLEFYKSSLEYLQEWIKPYGENVPAELTNWMFCSKNMDIMEVFNCATKFLPDLQLPDEVAEEIAELNLTLQQVRSDKFDKMTVSEKWSILLKNENFKYLAQIVDAVFAVACSNAECERIFSLMNVQWTDERNCLKLETVSKIVSLLINSDCMSCLKMFNYLKSVEEIATKISSTDKYNM